MFILLGFGDSGNGLTIGTIVYFSISGFLQILTIVIYYVFLRTDYAKFYMEKSKKNNDFEEEDPFESKKKPGLGNFNMEKSKKINDFEEEDPFENKKKP